MTRNMFIPAVALALGLLAGAGTTATSHAAPAAKATTVTVYKTPWCGCCKVWTDAMEEAGYKVDIHDMEDLSAVKKQAGVGENLEACHTAVIGGDRKYVLEGHVPLEAVRKLMSEMPDVRGIAVPGMPSGSLGMGYDPQARYTVYSFTGSAGETPATFMETGAE
ncbi:CopG family transcriptional regulator [Zhengella mangrovi]|uniref:CopG family transcriptional regulator n=1 Tax=Zhengella mangrovi TaxID=1982044 RepID=A0A2G1QH16_9HYPH|nr:DUF411 domain-containing protein [Zhengella mangrovi]PHP64759.1 CopG family transcriptional regulator [Zhengella mangrovi]